MAEWDIEYTDEFEAWWHTLSLSEQRARDFIPVADRLFDEHLDELRLEGDVK